MSDSNRWLLPDGVEDLLPPIAGEVERLRQRLLGLFERCGYEIVIPPLVEFVDSLLTGTGQDLDLKTFKFTDQVSGRLIGVRADMTPQVARIDAHSLNRKETTRLCYTGTLLHARVDHMLASRTPIRVGAELFGDTGVDGDLEIISLMLQAGIEAGLKGLRVEIGDVGIFLALLAGSGLTEAEVSVLFDLIQKKAPRDLEAVIDEMTVPKEIRAALVELPSLFGGDEVLGRAAASFSNFPLIVDRLNALTQVLSGLRQRFDDIELYVDLSELRGFGYHTGTVFAAYAGDRGDVIARGGRYDDVGGVFGRARGATGFDMDLRGLIEQQTALPEPMTRVLAPVGAVADPVGLWQMIERLRDEGYVVVEAAGTPPQTDCKLVHDGQQWSLAED